MALRRLYSGINVSNVVVGKKRDTLVVVLLYPGIHYPVPLLSMYT